MIRIILFIGLLATTLNQQLIAQCSPDVTPPQITNCPTDVAVDMDPDLCGAAVTWASPSYSDNCAIASVDSSHSSGDSFYRNQYSLDFDGTDDYFSTTDPIFGDVPYTFMAWIYPDDLSTHQSGFGAGLMRSTTGGANQNPGDFIVSVDNDGAVHFYNWRNAGEDADGRHKTADFVITEGVWQHVAVTWDGSTSKIYINGGDSSYTNLTTSLGWGNGHEIGRGWTNTPYHFNGKLDEVSIWATALTQSEIQDLMGTTINSLHKKSDSLKRYFHLDEGSGTTPRDTSGNGGHGTIVGAPVWSTSTPERSTSVYYAVTDTAGNVTCCSFEVSVNADNVGPVLTCPNDTVLNVDAGTCAAVFSYEVTASDNCGGNVVSQSSGVASGGSFSTGVTSNLFIATDDVANTSTCSFTVTVNDNIDPVINCPANISQPVDPSQCTAVVTYSTPVGTDNCPGPVTTLTQGDVSGSAFPVGVTTVEYHVADASGGTDACSFTITVTENNAPTITCPADTAIDNNATLCSAVLNYNPPVGTDDCPGATTTLSSGLGSGGTFAVGVSTEVYTVTDGSGSTNTCSFTVTVNDTELPLIACPSDFTVNNIDGLCNAVATYTDPVGTDNCAGATTTRTGGLGSGESFSQGQNVEIFTVTDGVGLTATCSFTITVADTSKPTITCPANIVSPIDPGQCDAVVTYATPSTTDNCPGETATLTSGLSSGSTFPTGETTVVWAATDADGNSESCSFAVTVTENVAPEITCPADFLSCSAVATYSTPVGTDNCAGPITTQIAGQASGTTFPVGSTVCTFLVTDAAQNTATCSFTITVPNVGGAVIPKISETESNFGQDLGKKHLFGSSIAGLGDFNGDGNLDLAIGAIGDDDGVKGKGNGAVYVLFLDASADVLGVRKISADASSLDTLLVKKDNFGASITEMGDLDSDGVTDLAVGAIGEAPINSVNGKALKGAGGVYILFMNVDGTVKSVKLITHELNGFTPNLDKKFAFGASVCNMGDLNNDGVNDIAIGCPGAATIDPASGKKLKEAGAVFISLLNADGTVISTDEISTESGNFNEPLGQKWNFGTGIANVGDIDGNGIVDVAVGARNATGFAIIGGKAKKLKSAGAVYVLRLNTDRTVLASTKISVDSPGIDVLDKKDFFGMSVANAGDIDDDGVGDIVVGAPFDDNSLENDAGAVYIINLTSSGGAKSWSKISPDSSSFTGTLDKKDQMGYGVGVMRNGCLSIIVAGAIGDDDNLLTKGTDNGAAWLMYPNGDVSPDKGKRPAEMAEIMDQLDNGTFDQDEMPDVSLVGQGSPKSAVIYPNPNSGNFNLAIRGLENEDYTVHVFDQMGRSVAFVNAKAETSESFERFDLSDLSSGLYLVEIRIGSTRLSKSVLISR